jgi:hypothetical protein
MNEFEREFQMVALGDCSGNRDWLGQTHGIVTVACVGWHTSLEGRQALEPLEVGDRVEDRDGDTWERTK